MAELNDIQALATISTIVEESEVKVILTNSCFKAQAYLFDKLRKESKRQNEICHFINEANLKLKTEIQIAEQQIKSSLLGQEIIKMANVELNKEFLIAKGKKFEIEERIKTGKKKYEMLWHESKTRYESLPLVRNLLKRRNKAQTLYNGLVNGKIQIESLENNIKTKKTTTFELDKSRILELAKYISHEMNRKINIIQEKSAIIFELTHEIDAIIKENSNVNNTGFNPAKNKDNALLCQDINEAREDRGNLDENTNDEHFLMPKLQLTNFDLDINLEQLKIKKSVTFVVTQPKVITFGSDSGITSQTHISKAARSFENEYLSLCYKIPNTDNEIRNTQNYSKRKLINILDDVKLNKNEAYEIISRINPSKFETVNVIVADSASLKSQPSTPKQRKLSQEDTKMEITEIPSDTDNILMPPSQFLDMTQVNTIGVINDEDPDSVLKNEDLTRTNENKKAVSFDVVSMQECIVKDTEELEVDANKQTVDAPDSQLNNSVVSEEDFAKIKNKILKERHLDLSPQFVYAKNDKAENKIVTSKFFQNDAVYIKPADTELTIGNKDDHIKEVEIEERVEVKEDRQGTQTKKDEDKIKSQLLKQPVRGMLFNHGSQCIPDSLNVSINTTGCDDGDADFPQFIDSSLLLSPKELPIPSSNNTDIQSEEVPHFLTGFRKTGLSFFGEKSSSDQKTENGQNQKNLFTFNFGSEEQKNKGGFFNMF